MTEDQSAEVKLDRSIRQLNRLMRKQTSFRYTFLRGIVSGLGTALGATLVFGLGITILLQILSTTSFLPFVNDIRESIQQELPQRRPQPTRIAE